MIAVGKPLPEATLMKLNNDGDLKRVRLKTYLQNSTVILIGMPGPFTPTCSKNHLPGYLHRRQELIDAGVDGIAVIAVTDAYAMDAWSVTAGGRGQLDFLADGNGTFTEAIGLLEDRSEDQMGQRSRRYSMLVADGVVRVLNVEDDQGDSEKTGADHMLSQISGNGG